MLMTCIQRPTSPGESSAGCSAWMRAATFADIARANIA